MYIVISLIPIAADPETIKKNLISEGFKEEDINISKYNIEGDLVDELEEDDTTKNFWDYLFGDSKWRTAYQKAGIDNNTLTVYTETLDDARKAKSLMDEAGALDIKKYFRENIDASYQDEADDHERIIAKARHNVYFLNGTRSYRPRSRGMNKRMDSLGSKD